MMISGIVPRPCYTGLVFLLPLGLLLGPGCGGPPPRPKLVKASGQVLVDGKPLEHGALQFIPDKGRPATATIGSGGRFVLSTYDPADGCPPGKYKVTVFSMEDVDKTTRRWDAPQKYNDLETTDIEVAVDKPTDALQIQLTWEGKKPLVEKLKPE